MIDRNYYRYSLYFPSGVIETGYCTNVCITTVATQVDIIATWDTHNWLNTIYDDKYSQETFINIPLRLKKVEKEEVIQYLLNDFEILKDGCQHPHYAKEYELQLAKFTSEEEIRAKLQKYVK